MILISEDGKSLVKIETWDDVIERPGYVEKIDAGKVKLKAIIGRYHVEPKKPCGILSCGTAHNMGYLVVCEGGIETNIGNKCGKNIFGVDFQTLEKTFTKDTNAQRFRERIAEFINQIGPIEQEAKFLLDGENQGEWCYQNMHAHMSRYFDEKTSDALLRRSSLGENRVFQEVALQGKELEAAIESGSKSRFQAKAIATISGIGAVRDYKKLRSILRIDLGEELQTFKALDPDQLNYDELKRWNSWANRAENKLRDAKNIIADCQRFLVESNIQTIRSYKMYL